MRNRGEVVQGIQNTNHSCEFCPCVSPTEGCVSDRIVVSIVFRHARIFCYGETGSKIDCGPLDLALPPFNCFWPTTDLQTQLDKVHLCLYSKTGRAGPHGHTIALCIHI